MPTKRRRIVRAQFGGAASITPTASELEWLTGEPQPGANRWWKFGRDAEKVTRCRRLLAECADLIPAGRRARLEADLRFWTPRPQRVSSEETE